MEKLNQNKTLNTIQVRINTHLLLISAIMAVVFVLAQFVVLATVGTKGAELTNIRIQMEKLRISNELLQSDIDKAKTTATLQEGVNKITGLQNIEVQNLTLIPASDSLISQVK